MKKSNYFVLFLICILTVLFTFYFCKIYSNSLINVDESSISDILTDVTGKSYEMLYNNINNYNKESHNYVIYVASYKGIDMSSFENRLRKIIVDSNFKNVIYINADELAKYDYINKLINDFSDGSFENVGVNNLPIFIFFKNEKIDHIVSIYNMDDFTLKDVLEGLYD